MATPNYQNLTSLGRSFTGSDLTYQRSPRHATHTFGQDHSNLFTNHPRLPFEFYVNINLYTGGDNDAFVRDFLDKAELQQLMPLIKSVDMPSIKIETTTLNQYNRKRVCQTGLSFEPVKMVMHDVVDGKSLRFWDMYYRYYFADGNEPGVNSPNRVDTSSGGSYSTDAMLASTVGPSASVNNYTMNTPAVDSTSSTNTNGEKSGLQNIVSDTLDNHNFGFNLETVGNIRSLIKSIDIYQVHGGKFNQVTLVNPRISAFTHDNLSYASSEKTVEITFTFAYEYAYYTLQNLDIGGGEPYNTSVMTPFLNGDYLELQSLAFSTSGADYATMPGPGQAHDNELLRAAGGPKNVQAPLEAINSAYAHSGLSGIDWYYDTSNRANYLPGSMSNRIQLFPKPYVTNIVPPLRPMPFKSVPDPLPVQGSYNAYRPYGTGGAQFAQGRGAYMDMNRASGSFGKTSGLFGNIGSPFVNR